MVGVRSDHIGTGPRIAVIIPCMNDGELLLEAVGSVSETEPLERVVVDDGSDDPATLRALQTVERAGVTVIRHERNLGVSEARNSGLAATSAPYVLPLDSDDLICPGALPQMADRLDAEPAAAACFGDYVEFGDHHLLVRGVPERIDPYRIAQTNEYPASALFRRAVLDGLGGWRRVGRNIDARADWNLWMTLAEHYASGVHLGRDQFTYLRRVHHGRLAEAARRHHRQIYRELRIAHPRLFAELRQSRKASDLSLPKKAFFSVAYGTRAWWPFEPRIVRRLDQMGLSTMAHPVKGAEADRLTSFVEGVREAARARLPNAGSRNGVGYDRPLNDVREPANP